MRSARRIPAALPFGAKRYEHHGIRRCVHANYLIFYRVQSQQIDVIHILNGAQDYETLLFPPR